MPIHLYIHPFSKSSLSFMCQDPNSWQKELFKSYRNTWCCHKHFSLLVCPPKWCKGLLSDIGRSMEGCVFGLKVKGYSTRPRVGRSVWCCDFPEASHASVALCHGLYQPIQSGRNTLCLWKMDNVFAYISKAFTLTLSTLSRGGLRRTLANIYHSPIEW